MSYLHYNPPNLLESGPTITVNIFPPKAVRDSLDAEGKPYPIEEIDGLVDTGASCTCIDNEVAQRLNLVPMDITPVLTPAGESIQLLYDITVAIKIRNVDTKIFTVQAIGANLKKQPYGALIGRDILKQCSLIYDGWNNSYTLHF